MLSVFFSALRPRLLALAPLFVYFLFAVAATAGLLSGGLWAVLGLGGGILLALLVGGGEGRFPMPSRPSALWVACALGAAFLSCLYAVDPALSFHESLKLVTILFPLLFLSSPRIRKQGEAFSARAGDLALWLCLGFAAFNLVLLYKTQTITFERDFIVSKMNRGLSYGVMLSFPVLAALWGRERPAEGPARRAPFFLLASGLMALLLTGSQATQLGVFAASMVVLAARFYPFFVGWLLRLGAAMAMAWPLLAAFFYTNRIDLVLGLPDSWLARMEIWDYMGSRIAERPLLGYGIGNSHLVKILFPHGDLYIHTKTVASHPHNAVTQLWGELGLMGLGLWLFLSFWAIGAALRLPERVRPFALGAYVFALWLSLVAYDFWTDSLWAAFALIAFAFSTLKEETKLKLP